MKQSFLALLAILLIAACSEDDDPVTVMVVADFTASQFAIEEGGSIDFTDLSMGDPTTWSWTFEGGEPATSNEQNPTVTYTTAGTYEVSLAVANESSEDTEKKEAFITIDEPPVVTGLFDETMMFDGEEREYFLYIPESYTGDEAVPLLFDLHTDLGSKENQYQSSQFNLIADVENFILVTPESLIPRNTRQWNYNNDPDAADDVGFINALMDLIINDYNINIDRIYVAGSSGGAVMAFNLICQSDERIAAITAVKGIMNEAVFTICDPARPIPILQMHGTADPVIPYEPAVPTTIGYWVMQNQTSQNPVITAVPDEYPDNGITVDYILLDDGTNGVTVEHFRVNGAGHAWFKKPNHDVDASEEAWRFFSKFDINGRI